MGIYEVRLYHTGSNSVVAVTINAGSLQSAIRSVLDIEGAPRHAVLTTTLVRWIA